MIWYWVVFGVGSFIGAIIMACCAMAGRADEESEKGKKGVGRMKETKIYCDHCGTEIHGSYEKLEFNFAGADFFRADLCSKCHKEVVVLVKDFCNKTDGKDENNV